MSLDLAESLINAGLGLVVSWAATWLILGYSPAQSLAEKIAGYPTIADLDGLLDGYALTKREPPRDVIEAIARRRAELQVRK